MDSSGNSLNLTRIGSPLCATTPDGLSVTFNGTDSGFSSSVPTTVTYNFGIEDIVKISSTSANSFGFYHGIPYNDGWGLIEGNGFWYSVVGFVTFGTSTVPVVLNQWTELAIVRDNGVTIFYENGVAT